MSDCDQVRERLPLWVGGEDTGRDTAALAEHLRVCPACAEQARAYMLDRGRLAAVRAALTVPGVGVVSRGAEQVSRGAAQVASPVRSSECVRPPESGRFWADLRSRMAAEVPSPGKVVVLSSRPMAGWRRFPAMAAAAVLVMALGLVFIALNRGQGGVGADPAAVMASSSKPAELSPPETTETAVADPNLRPLAPVSRRVARHPAAAPVLERAGTSVRGDGWPSERALYPLEPADPVRVRPVDWEF